MTVDRALLVQLARADGSWVDVGVLYHRDESTWFETMPSYWALADRPVLGQVFEERGPAWRTSSSVRLPPWFSHLLPEGRLRRAVAQAADVKEQREFFLLARIGGDDLPGALRTLPYETTLSGEPPGEAALEDATGGGLGPLKFSLAGLQLKFSLFDGQRGLTVPARGEAGNVIVKLPDRRPGYEGVPEAELAGLEVARAAGIDVPEAWLVDVTDINGLPDWATAGGGQALVVRRFDRRPGGGRVHFEELAQILEVSTSRERDRYERANFETVANYASALCGTGAVGQIIDRIVLNVLLGNGDAHVKNWAFTYPDGRRARLSPAYDIVPTVLFIADDDLGLKLANSRAFADVRPRSFERLAERAGWDPTAGSARAIDAVERVVDAWPLLNDHLPRHAVAELTARRDALPLVKKA